MCSAAIEEVDHLKRDLNLSGNLLLRRAVSEVPFSMEHPPQFALERFSKEEM